MKKILLTTAAALILAASSAQAEDNFYVKLEGGVAKPTFTPYSVNGAKPKIDSKMAGLATVGFGYNFMENLRSELAFTHYFGVNLSTKVTDAAAGTYYAGKVNGNANSFMLNIFADIVDLSAAKLFLGAGAGVSWLGGKVTAGKYNTADNSKIEGDEGNFKSNAKFTGALYAGLSTEISPDVNAELTYSYRFISNPEIVKSLGTHNLTAGVRFGF